MPVRNGRFVMGTAVRASFTLSNPYSADWGFAATRVVIERLDGTTISSAEESGEGLTLTPGQAIPRLNRLTLSRSGTVPQGGDWRGRVEVQAWDYALVNGELVRQPGPWGHTVWQPVPVVDGEEQLVTLLSGEQARVFDWTDGTRDYLEIIGTPGTGTVIFPGFTGLADEAVGTWWQTWTLGMQNLYIALRCGALVSLIFQPGDGSLQAYLNEIKLRIGDPGIPPTGTTLAILDGIAGVPGVCPPPPTPTKMVCTDVQSVNRAYLPSVDTALAGYPSWVAADLASMWRGFKVTGSQTQWSWAHFLAIYRPTTDWLRNAAFDSVDIGELDQWVGLSCVFQ